ncbi:hypothetical protein [Hymenobacter cellulosilyticus]|uniref:Uncharacterized protein n=1 Tax=Hymenobacter cellulosilyticus TaxID=2932248 RepID=A0A8T9PYR2_9BACT|nr:hypothetical protein [Hymenobacter cellulosilyticus]UOQ70384.1 hypothetical protein MUN79_16740 [Hymenobacter cellulosilyticus]
MEAILLLLFLLLALLFVVALGLVQYVIIPWALLRAFFRSDWAPQGLKDVVAWTLGIFGFLVIGFLGWNWYRQWQDRQATAAQSRWPPVRLTAQQPGLLPYPLGRGRIEAAHYTTAPLLIVSGDLVVEGRLRASFTASPGIKFANETDLVQVSTDKGEATQATGRSFYDPLSHRVSGSFHCVLPSGRPLSISFPPTPVSPR